MVRLNKLTDVLYGHKIIKPINFVLTGLLCIYFSSCIAVAILYSNQECEAPLTSWLVVFGVLGFIIVILKDIYLLLKDNREKHYLLRHLVRVFILVVLVASVWNIVGGNWCYRMASQPEYNCPTFLAQFGFWSITTALLEFLFAFIVFLSIMGLMCKFLDICSDY